MNEKGVVYYPIIKKEFENGVISSEVKITFKSTTVMEMSSIDNKGKDYYRYNENLSKITKFKTYESVTRLFEYIIIKDKNSLVWFKFNQQEKLEDITWTRNNLYNLYHRIQSVTHQTILSHVLQEKNQEKIESWILKIRNHYQQSKNISINNI